MAIPDFQTLMLPFLRLASDGKEGRLFGTTPAVKDVPTSRTCREILGEAA